MTAFIPAVAPTSFTTQSRPTLCGAGSAAPTPVMAPARRGVSMTTANWPGDESAPYGKYLANIPLDRLNKAPIITINTFADASFNSISVRLADLPTDVAAGNALKAATPVCDEEAAPASVWGRYYDPATVNEAPIISMFGDDGSPHAYISVVQTTVPTNIAAAADILGPTDDPDPALYSAAFDEKVLNKAPVISVFEPANGEKGQFVVDDTPIQLNTYAAASLLAGFRS